MDKRAMSMESESVAIMRRCPRFGRCSAPVCPLDLLQEARTYGPGEPKCSLSKAKWNTIGQATALPWLGLTKREWAGLMRWQGLSEAEKARQEAILRGFWSICPGDLKASGQERLRSHIHG